MAMSVGKAQAKVLEALNLMAWNNVQAQNFFTLLGLQVVSRREGRESVPIITVEPRGRREERGGWVGEEGDVWMEQVGAGLPIFDMSAILQWVTNPDEAERITALAQERDAKAPTRDDLMGPAAEKRLYELWAR